MAAETGRRNNAGPQVDDALHNFSKALEPTPEYLREEKALAEKVFDALKTSSKYAIARQHYGRNKAIMCDPDVELTVFINVEEPPFKDVLEDFASVIKASFGISDTRQSTCSLQFTIPEIGIDGRKQYAGFNIELIPAVNLVPSKTRAFDIAKIQLAEVTKRIEQDPKKHHFYSSSLVESHQDFMRQQNAYTEDLIRLAKFWYKSLFMGEHVPGGNTIVELVAIVAARVRRTSLHDAFMVFLSHMNRLDHFRLAYYFEQGVWEIYHSSAREIDGYIPPRISSRFPGMNVNGMDRFILDPANHYNDLLAPLSFTVIRKFMRFARETMDRFKIPRVHSIDKGEPFLLLHSYFRPLPTKLISADPAIHLNSTSADYLIGFIAESSSSFGLINPVMTVRNINALRSSKIRKAHALQNLVDAHLQFITTTANAATHSGKPQNLMEIVDSVCQMIDQDIRGAYHQKWMTNTAKTHETHDITFKVPVSTAEGLGAIIVSVKWDYRGRGGNCYKQ